MILAEIKEIVHILRKANIIVFRISADNNRLQAMSKLKRIHSASEFFIGLYLLIDILANKRTNCKEMYVISQIFTKILSSQFSSLSETG
jgi:hypothetical protein